jgi:glycosyltransferase involved in cell wall biosynthesis
MRNAYRLADKSIIPVPLERAAWLPSDRSKAVMIPVGPNIPAMTACHAASIRRKPNNAKIIAVFGMSEGSAGGQELTDIAHVVNGVANRVGRVRLTTLGRGSKESELRLRQALNGGTVEFSALGVLSAETVSKVLMDADVSLFVRGPVSTNRGSAIASMACGIPLVAYSTPTLPLAFSEAGVLGVGVGDRDATVDATVRVLTDNALRLELHRRNRVAFETYLSWEAIARRFEEVLTPERVIHVEGPDLQPRLRA